MEQVREQQLLEEIAKRDRLIALLEQKIDALNRRLYGVKSEARDPAQLELLLNPEAAKTAPAADGPGAAPASGEPRRKPKGNKAPRQPRIPAHLPVVEEILDPPEVLANPDAWRRIGEEVREQLHFKRGGFVCVRTVRPKYVSIGQPFAKPVVAALPPCLQERCVATPGLIAEIIDNRFTCHLPYYRQAEMFARLGVPLHRKTLCEWAGLGSHWLAIIYRAIEYEHWLATYRQLDETPLKYLDPGYGKARTGYLWLSNIPGGSVLYRWRTGRDAGGIGELFGEGRQDGPKLDEATIEAPGKIVLQCDGFSAYPGWARPRPWIELSGCHAHMRRKFLEAEAQVPKFVGWILRQIGHLYQVEEDLRQAGAGPALRAAVRAARSRPVHRRLKKAIDLLAARKLILPKSLLGKAVQYAIGQWKNLEVYLTDGRVEIDNNLAENAIRPTKLGAKNWLFIGSEVSGEKAAILYTIVENCRRLDINVREYIEDVLTRLPAMKAGEAASLTPANWLKARGRKTVRKVA